MQRRCVRSSRWRLARLARTPSAQNEKLVKIDGTKKIDEGLCRSLIGCLVYLTATRPDIIFSGSLLSRFMHCASEEHFKAAKRVLRYVSETSKKQNA